MLRPTCVRVADRVAVVVAPVFTEVGAIFITDAGGSAVRDFVNASPIASLGGVTEAAAGAAADAACAVSTVRGMVTVAAAMSAGAAGVFVTTGMFFRFEAFTAVVSERMTDGEFPRLKAAA